MIVFPYNPHSESARLLSKALGVKIMKNPSKYKGGVVLNWGNAKEPLCKYPIKKYINHPKAVHIAIDKLRTFEALKKANVSHVPFTTSKEVAKEWQQAGKVVFARTTKGHSGAGITVVNPGDPLPDSPLYTQYVKKRKEFRVHVVNGTVVDVAEKRREIGVENDPLIRSHLRGWVFCRENIEKPLSLDETGVAAVKALGLDFGAVDIIWNEKQNTCYVLEINSAPGITGTTLESYKNALLPLV